MDLKLKLSLLLLVISISITGIFGFEGGDGSNDDPFQIATCEQLQNMSSNLSAYYILVDNVNCNVAPFNIGLGFEPVGTSATPFTGSLNGQNYTISNLFMDRNIVAMGLFGQINNAIISNININNFSIITGTVFSGRHGLLVGTMRGSLVENISFEGSIFSSSSSNNLGGLIGNTFTPQNEVRNIVGNVTIEYDQVSNSGSVGGLLGNGNTVLISNISIISNIRGTINNGGGVVGDLGSSSTLEYVIAQVFLNGTRTTFNNRVGGIIGLIQQGAVVRNVVVNGSVRGTDSYRVGGIIGEIINGRIQNSYSNVTLISNGVVGGAVGLVGSSLTGNYLENVYSKGLVTNLSGVGGGLIGTNGASLAGIVNSFWDIETSNQIISVGGEGRTTEEMNNLSTFAQFGDFETIWAINFEDNSQYPFLRFQGFVPTNQFANDGVGTIENPYQIENCNQLQQMRFLLNSHYILINDIDCSDTINWNSGEGFIPVGDPSTHFMGSLNGQDFTINNLFINRTSDYSGLFGNVDSANIENLMMNNASVIGEDRTGTLVGLAASSTFENITVSNSLSWAFESF